ncbi:MAG: cobalamin biosynthesis protein [Rubrivivax sp.]
MIVAGLGFRSSAGVESLRAALAAAGAQGADALATSERKAAAPAMQALAAETGLPLLALPEDLLAAQTTLTESARVRRLTGAGSLAEAAALAGAGPGARLLGERAVSADGQATAALAQSAKDER